MFQQFVKYSFINNFCNNWPFKDIHYLYVAQIGNEFDISDLERPINLTVMFLDFRKKLHAREHANSMQKDPGPGYKPTTFMQPKKYTLVNQK